MSVQIKQLFFRGTTGAAGPSNAINISYDNASSGLAGTNVQAAIDEIVVNTTSVSRTFNNTSSWTGPVDNAYSISIPFSIHGKTNPTVAIFELMSLDYVEVEASITIAPSNDIIIDVPASPDLRFIGKVTIT